MAALAKDRNTVSRAATKLSIAVAASVKIYAGALVAVNASGYATPGATAITLKAIGRADEQVDNSSGGDGDLKVEVSKGVFRYDNSASSDAITTAEIGSECYIVDDQTVAKTDGAGTRSKA